MTAYAELAVTTNFSFLRGGSHPGEMVGTAEALGLSAIGIADRNSFAGVVRAYEEWRKRKAIKLVVGIRLVTIDGFEVLTYPTDRAAYGRLCQLLSACNRKIKKGEKGECQLTFEDILAVSEGQMLIVLPPEELSPAFAERLTTLARAVPGRTFLAGVHRSPVLRDAGAVFSTRGGDFVITVGGDLSAGYRWHDRESIHLFCAETIAAQTMTPDAVCVLG